VPEAAPATPTGAPGETGTNGLAEVPTVPPGAPRGAPAGARERFAAPGFPGIDCVPAPRAQVVPEIPEEPLSAIEREYEELAEPTTPLAERRLRQFGYEVFRAPATTFAPVEDVPVGRDYVLGPGDELTIYVWGLVESVFSATVNRNGEIFVPRAGTLKVWGLTFEKAEQLIRDQLAKVYTGFQISVTLGRLRAVRVFVVGSVARPGSYTLSPLSTITNALFTAGGPTKQGTLRRIQLVRDNRTESEVDFYDFLLRGEKRGDVRLESGDTVFVPQIGPVVALVGRVNQPAIYELKAETRVADLLTLAGGVTPRGFLERVQIERFQANRERVVLDFDLLGFYQRGQEENNPVLKNGDLVRVFPVDLRIYNAASLEGLVKRPGRYALRPGMRVADLLVKEELLPDAYLDRAEIVRVREDLGTEVIPFSIRDAWAGKPDANVELKPLDRVVVRSQMRPIEEVVVTGMVKRPGQYAITRGERLSSLLARAGGFEPGAFPRGAVFTRRAIRLAEQQQLDKFVRTQEQSLLAETSAVTAGVTQLTGENKAEVASAQATVFSQRRELLRSLASAVTLGRVAIRLDDAVLKERTWDIELEDGDTLYVPPQPTSVLVLGAVRNSTALLYTGAAERPDFYVAQAGGPTREADLDQMYVLKPDGSTISSFPKVYNVEAGDTIVVPLSTEPRYRTLPMIRDIATILTGFALPFATVAALLK
jgi:protein involved in polysaccharide export with SLBB domain